MYTEVEQGKGDTKEIRKVVIASLLAAPRSLVCSLARLNMLASKSLRR